MSLGLVDTPQAMPMLNIHNNNFLDYCKLVPSFLSLDISVRGTGWVMWRNNQLTWGRLTLKQTGEVERAHEFAEFLLNLISGYSFDYFFVEDCIASVNFKTARSLMSLNSVLEDLIYRKQVTAPIKLYKMPNKTWKKNLKALAGSDLVVPVSGNDKECTKACLRALSVDISVLKQNKYTDKQVEDICDALGMALGTIAIDIKQFKIVQSKPITCDIRKGFKIRQFTSYTEARKSAERLAKAKSKEILDLDIDKSCKSLVNYLAPVIPEHPNSVIIAHTYVSSCCNLLLLKQLETSAERYFLVITR